MSKRLLSLLLALVLLLALAPAASAEGAIADEEELLAFLARQKEAQAAEFAFTCEPALFTRLMAEDAALLNVLQIKAGIGEARVQYSEQSCLIRFSQVAYSDAPWAECRSEGDACIAVQRILAQEPESFHLLCSPDLAQSLANSGNLRNYAAQAGFVNIQFRYYTNGVIEARDPEPFPAAWAAADDMAQFDAAVERFALQELDEFDIVFSPSFYRELTEDEELFTILHVTSMLDRYSYSAQPIPGVLHYYRVSYTQDPCLVCRSEADVRAAISHMGPLGITSFRLYLADEGLRELLIDKPLAYPHELEVRSGLVTADNIYHNNNTIFYKGAYIVAEADFLSTPEEACAWLEEQAETGARAFTLFCAPELYALLLGEPDGLAAPRDGMGPLYDLLAQAGISDCEITANRATGAVSIAVRSYCPGREILRAAAAGTEAELPERQREALEAARALAEECKTADPLETARRIHDALCERIVYADEEESDEDDGAVGALLNGRANSAGYSDAFYLVGTLAGLEVRCQRGESRVKGPGVVTYGETVPHTWNLLLLDGSWRLVDLSWDDEEDGPFCSWFNLGYDRAGRSHVWNEEMSVPLLEKTDLRARPENEFSVRSAAEMEKAVDTALVKGYARFSLVFDGQDYADWEAALERIGRGVSGSFRYTWLPELRELRVTLT